MAQQPPPQAFQQNYGYMQKPGMPQMQPPMPQQQPPQNGQNNQNLVNGGYPQNVSPMAPPMNPMNPLKPPMAMPAQQQQVPPVSNLPPTTANINYQNFQTNALHGGLNGSNSALSSRTSSPGIQQTSTPPNTIPTSQLPPSKSYPSYQHLHGSQQLPSQPSTLSMPQPTLMNPQQQQQQQPMPAPMQPPSSQFPMASTNVNNNNLNNNNNNNVGEINNTQQQQIPTSNFNTGLPQMPQTNLPPVAGQQHHLSASMANLTLNNSASQNNFPTQQMPSSKSDQNLLNNNNLQNKPMQKRPMYPQQQPTTMQQMPQQQPFQATNQQNQQFNSFPGVQQPQGQPQMAARSGNLQYQNFQQQPQQQQQFPAGSSVVHQGFNRMWGRETVDLMQNRHILPTTKVLPPPVKLNHQFHEATNCNPDIFRCTLTKIPESNSLLQKSRLPLGILIHPYRDLSVSRTSFIYIRINPISARVSFLLTIKFFSSFSFFHYYFRIYPLSAVQQS